MYRRYYNEYEKKAMEIKNAPPKETEIKPSPPPTHSLRHDDILILGLIFFLIKEGNADKILILALGFIFISGF